MTRVRIEIVGAETGLEQLVGRVAFPDRPLARPEHADAARPALCKRAFELLGHDVEGFVPGHLGEFAVLVVFAVLLAQKRMREAIVAVHDFREKISFDAIEAAIDLGLGIAVGRYNPAVLGCDHDSATGAAKSAGRLVPFQFGDGSVGNKILRGRGRWHSAHHCCHRSSFQFQEFTAVHSIPTHMVFSQLPQLFIFAVVELIPHPCRETPVLPSARPASSKSC